MPEPRTTAGRDQRQAEADERRRLMDFRVHPDILKAPAPFRILSDPEPPQD